MSLETLFTRILGGMQSPDEQYLVALKALEGRETGWQKPGKAFRFFKYAADRGHLESHLKLGECHEYGVGTVKAPTEAIRFYRQAVKLGCFGALSRLGDCYRTGTGVEKDFREALALYQQAAEQGEPGGQNGLGLCYANGLGVQQDDVQAVRWYTLAADSGHAEAQFNLGRCYSQGLGVAQNLKIAADCYALVDSQATEGLDQQQRIQTQPIIAKAQFALAECYALGTGVIRSDSRAQLLYRRAAMRGHTEACRKYAACLNSDSGSGGSSTADHWLRRAEALDNS